MGLNRFFLICLIALLFLSPVYARDYSLRSASADVTVRQDGVVHVTESITYTFEGTYREVFRRVYPPPGGSIENIGISCQPQPCEGRVDKVSGSYELVGVLPQPTPSEIVFVVSYDYYRGLKVHDDVSELHYKLWGEDWEKPLGTLAATIHLPPTASGETRYWLHPSTYIQSQDIEGETISVETGRIPANSWFEIRAVFPRIEAPDPSKVRVIKGDGLPEILRIEADYAAKQGRAKNLYLLVWFLAAIIAAVPLYIYHRYGREPDINYHALYEREPPSDSKPAAVNAIMRGSIGKPDLNAFFATIMDLVDRGFISLKDVKTEKSYLGLFTRSMEDIIIEINEKETSGLLDFELDALKFLLQNSKDGRISWLNLKEKLGKDSTFYDFIIRWGDLLERHIKVEKIFISTGNYFLMAFGFLASIFAILLAIVVARYYPLGRFPEVKRAVLPGAVIFVTGVLSLIIALVNEKGAGRFTPEGRLYYERWRRFRDYLEDFSALKEHPPESIRLWDRYMVYAVALGVAEKVIKNMSRIVPKEEIKSSGFYAIQNQPDFFTGLHSAYNASNPASSAVGGGVGGVGGGFGGGGGGAR